MGSGRIGETRVSMAHRGLLVALLGRLGEVDEDRHRRRNLVLRLLKLFGRSDGGSDLSIHLGVVIIVIVIHEMKAALLLIGLAAATKEPEMRHLEIVVAINATSTLAH
jgi:hypothetical protein